MTISDQDRLSHIRSDNEQWLATEPNAEAWDVTFLLKKIDHLQKELKRATSRLP